MKTVSVKEYGVLPGCDCTLALRALTERFKEDTEFVFENADYYLSPHEEMRETYYLSNTIARPYRVLGLWLKEAKNIVLRGNGARLWFAGQMQPMTFDRCENVRTEGFTINWKKPLVAESEILAVTDTYLDIAVDPERFPHRFRDGTLEFDVGNDEWYPLKDGMMQFDRNSRTVVHEGSPYVTKLEEIGEHRYRLTLGSPVNAAAGNILVLRHNLRIHAAVFCEKCRDMTFEGITVHSCGGLGCLSQFCHNLTFRRINYLPDTASGRFVTGGRDDGIHMTCNSGTLTVEDCSFVGLMDDPINVHSCCVIAEGCTDRKTVRCRYGHVESRGFLYWAEPGDTISFIERRHMQTIFTAKAAEFIREDLDTFTLRFAEELPEEIVRDIQAGNRISLDNADHTADFICRGNRFGSCRARGVLVSTPGKVEITDNLFDSSGTALLIAGDSNGWFESGACRDVTVRNNVFTDRCLSSMYQFCEGVISVCPVVPEPLAEKPYHTNIRIENNVFDSANVPVLYAFSCGGLTFSGNRIHANLCAEPWHPGKAYLSLRCCRDAKISGNTLTGRPALEGLAEESCIGTEAEPLF